MARQVNAWTQSCFQSLLNVLPAGAAPPPTSTAPTTSHSSTTSSIASSTSKSTSTISSSTSVHTTSTSTSASSSPTSVSGAFGQCGGKEYIYIYISFGFLLNYLKAKGGLARVSVV
ncbi:hypothetical protein GYMLUDRAFT_321604 [Collybiopsis luxurians FD-317 M1]|nr:hypothetical protein GYMLUDRAFT_321604 [Collybiopsis luxurians FD-317 M1]